MIPAVLIEDGQLVTSPGFYEMSLGWYHQQCCWLPSFSNTTLKQAWKAPAYLFATSDLNPNRRLPKVAVERPHFSIGRAAHHLLFLGPKGFTKEFIVRPDYYEDYRTKDAQVWKREVLAAGLTIVTPEELFHIEGMAASLARHPMVKQGILDGAVERSMVYVDPETGLIVKSRPDNITTWGGDFSDLKTCESVTDEGIDRTLKLAGYHIQAATTGLAWQALTGEAMATFSFVWVEKTPPYCVRVTQLPNEDRVRGEAQVQATLRILRTCLDRGVWPGPDGDRDDAEERGLDQRTRDRIDARLALLQAIPDPLDAISIPDEPELDEDDEPEEGAAHG